MFDLRPGAVNYVELKSGWQFKVIAEGLIACRRTPLWVWELEWKDFSFDDNDDWD